MEIEKLGLSVRTYNAVKRFGINTVEELAERIDEFCKHAQKSGEEAREVLKNMELPQPQESPVIVETAEYTKAVTLHRKICVSAELAEQNLFEMCKGLCEMRDYKLYRELGYKNFEDYCTQELKITRRQGQKYAAIASLETIDNGKSTSHFEKLGTEKLYLLSQIEETARIEIMGNTDLENTSVRELKAEIDRLKKDIKTQQDNYSMHTKRREDEIAGYKERQDKLLQKNKELVSDVQRVEGERDKLESDLDEAKDTVQSLSKQLEELENRPRDTYEDTTKINELKKQLAEAEERHRAELANAQSVPAEDVRGVFKAYMIAAVDALRNLTQFTEKHMNAPEKSIFIEKLENVDILINQTISKLKGV